MASPKIAPRFVNDLIDILFRGGTWYGHIDSLPSSLYLALLTAEPYAQGDYLYFDDVHEVTYTGYARRTIGRSLTGFRATQGGTSASSGSSGTTGPVANAYFPICTTSSQTVTHAALVTHSSLAAYNNDVFCYWTLPRPFQLSNASPGFYPCLYAAGLSIRLDN